MQTGVAPPPAPRFVHAAQKLRRDARGIIVGGIRTPTVDVPVAVESGEPGPGGKAICSLFGTSTPFPPAMLHRLYGSKATYLQRYDRAAAASVSAATCWRPTCPRSPQRRERCASPVAAS